MHSFGSVTHFFGLGSILYLSSASQMRPFCCTALLLLGEFTSAQSTFRRPGVLLPEPGQYLTAGIEHDFELPPDEYQPRSLDVSAYFPVAGDQHQQASCTAWAIGYGLATFRRNWERDHRPDKSHAPDPRDVFSPAFLFNMVKRYEQPDSNCLSGVDIAATFTIACEWGNCPWQLYPYDSRNDGCNDPLDTALLRVTRAYALPTAVTLWKTNTGVGAVENPFDPVQWKYHMARKEPLVVSFSIDCSFVEGGDRAGREGRPFIWDVATVSDNDNCAGGHAMVCTGYDDRDSTFTFLNSFGLQWGERGYVRIPYHTLRESVRAAYIFSQRWWSNVPVPPGKPRQKRPVTDSTLSASIKPGQVHRFHDLELRVVTISPDERNIVVQFRDTASTKPVVTMEFPRGVKRSFLYEDKLWSFTWTEPGFFQDLFSSAVPFIVKVDEDEDEELEAAMDRHYARWRR